jgi:hypothetical protein
MMLILGATIVPARLPATDVTPFTSALQRVIRAGRENFRPLEGARIEMHPGNISYYEARLFIPGTTECRVDEQPVRTYSCHWKAAHSGEPACGRLLEQVAAALPEWLRSDGPAGATFREHRRYRGIEVSVKPPVRAGSTCVISVAVRPDAR